MTNRSAPAGAGELRLLRAVAIQADALQEQTEAIGTVAAQAMGSVTAGRSQMSGLEAIANSTIKLSDVLDYVKVRTARQRGWQTEEFGFRLVDFLLTEVKSRAQNIASRETLSDEDRQRVTLLLAQATIRQIVAHYEFARAFPHLVGSTAPTPTTPASVVSLGRPAPGGRR